MRSAALWVVVLLGSTLLACKDSGGGGGDSTSRSGVEDRGPIEVGFWITNQSDVPAKSLSYRRGGGAWVTYEFFAPLEPGRTTYLTRLEIGPYDFEVEPERDGYLPAVFLGLNLDLSQGLDFYLAVIAFPPAPAP